MTIIFTLAICIQYLVWTDQCFNASVIYNDYTRDISHTRKLGESDKCESQTTMPGWYRYDDNHIIPTQPVLSGQCGSSSPIYLQGCCYSKCILFQTKWHNSKYFVSEKTKEHKQDS
jgi:hypothetical protein